MEKPTAAFRYGNVPAGTIQTPSGAGASTHKCLAPQFDLNGAALHQPFSGNAV